MIIIIIIKENNDSVYSSNPSTPRQHTETSATDAFKTFVSTTLSNAIALVLLLVTGTASIMLQPKTTSKNQ